MAIHRLSDTKVRNSRPGLKGDGGGLWLRTQVGKDGDLKRSWLFRYGKHWHGLGSVDDVPLAKARELRQRCREMLREGIDPIANKKARKSEAALTGAKAKTFEDYAGEFLREHAAEWRSTKNGWYETLRGYAYPVIGKMLLKDVDTTMVLKVLQPHWATKTTTMSRLRGRIEKILTAATVQGYRTGENPARWKGHLKELLPAPSKIAPVQNMEAMPYGEIGGFMEELCRKDSVPARALEFTILVAARSNEVLGAKFDEIDGDVWTIPAERTKRNREHRVPLSPRALAIIEAMRAIRHSDFVFPGGRGGKPHETCMRDVLKDLGRQVTVHGFRSSFRDWTSEQTATPHDVAEAALAHTRRDKTVTSYRRTDFLEKRRRLMQQWAEFCSMPKVEAEVRKLRA
jgi:integrase